MPDRGPRNHEVRREGALQRLPSVHRLAGDALQTGGSLHRQEQLRDVQVAAAGTVHVDSLGHHDHPADVTHGVIHYVYSYHSDSLC